MRIKTGSPIDPSLFGFPPDGVFLPVTAISTDSREICPGDLFVALTGNKTDGAAYIPEAFSRGASLVLSHRASGDDPRVRGGSDPLAVLFDAAVRYARAIPHKTVGITGSYGKTTLRHHLCGILSAACPVAYTAGNGNTDLALALTLLSMSPDTRILIAELGMRGRGEIARLSRLIRPDLSVITAIGSAHIGLLGSIEAIRDAKCEITDGMGRDGLLLYPANDPLLSFRVESLPVRPASVSVDPAYPATYTLKTHGISDGKALVSLFSPAGEIERVPLPGCDPPILCSAAFCFAVCEALGIDRGITRRGLTRLSPPPLRRQIEKIGGVTVLLDCYNASPEPTALALDSLARYRDEGKRLFLLLGDMFELGDASVGLHRMIGRRAAALSPARLLCVGEYAKEYALGAIEAGLSRKKTALYARDELPEVARDLRQRLSAGDLLFIKGSRALALESVIPRLNQAEN